MINKNNTSIQAFASIGGILYLIIIIAGTLGQIFVRGSLVTADAASTVNNLTTSTFLWRIGITGDLMMHIIDIPLMIILYMLLRPVNKHLALLGVLFNIIQTAVLVANKSILMIPLILLSNPEYVEAFGETQFNAIIYLLTEIHDYGFILGLIFFGFACSVYGYLIIRSGYFPKILGIMMAVAGLSYITNGFTLILFPAYYDLVFPLLVLCLIAELSFSLWLLFKGVNISKWENAIALPHKQEIK